MLNASLTGSHSLQNMSTLITIKPEGNIAEFSASRSFPIQERGDDHSSKVNICQNEKVSEDIFSFHIRHFVSNVRQRDFSKCWPFRQQILEKCLSIGLKPFLPPLEPLQKECDNKAYDYGLQQVSSSGEDKILRKEIDDQALNNIDKERCTVALIGMKSASIVEGEKYCSFEINTSEGLERDLYSDGKLGEFKAIKPGQEVGIATSGQSKGNVPQLITSSSLNNMNHSNCVMETDGEGDIVQSIPLIASKNSLSEIEGADLRGLNVSEVDTVSVLDAEHDFNCGGGGLLKDIQQFDKTGYNSLSNEFPAFEGKGSSFKSKNSDTESPDEVLQDEAQSLSETPAVFNHEMVSCRTVGLLSRLERNSKNGDESSFTGLNLDALVPQVCPVCLNFTSTSNTALNAHIDHCLESVLPGEKGESRTSKHRIKPRKMRSMVDICATAPSRTLANLEQSTKIWALNDDKTKEDSACSPTWNRGLVRRQPRTSLHRGLVWKARVGLEKDDTLQVSASDTTPQLENSQEGVIARQHKLTGWIQDTTTMALKSCEYQPLNSEGRKGALEAASPVMGLDQISHAKKKKKTVSTNMVLPKDITSAERCKLVTNEENKNYHWSVSPDLLGLTIIDTSAEEERRLLQNTKCVNGEETDTGKLPKEGSVDIGSESGKPFKQQFLKGPPFSDLTSKKWDHKSSNKIVKKKRLCSWAESERLLSDGETSSEEDFDLFSDKSMKTKKATPKIKSLLTVVANSCKEKEIDVIEGHNSQKTTSVQENVTTFGVNTPQSGELRGCQETRSIRKNLVNTLGERREGLLHSSKRACVLVEKPAFSENPHPCSLLNRHGKSSEEISVLSGRDQYQEEEPYTGCQEQEFFQISSLKAGDEYFQGDGFRTQTSLLSMRQAECSPVAEKRAYLIKVASTKDVLVKASLSSKDPLDPEAIGMSSCRSEYNSAIRTSISSPFIEACAREDVSTQMYKGVEQSSKAQSCIPQCLTVSSTGGSSYPLANFVTSNPLEVDQICGVQMSALQNSVFSESTTNVQLLNNLGSKKPCHNSQGASNCGLPIVRDCGSLQTGFAPQFVDNSQAKDFGRKIWKGCVKPLADADCFESFGECRLKCSAQSGPGQPLGSYDICKTSGSNLIDNRLNAESGNHFVSSKMDHAPESHVVSETLQRVANHTMPPMVPGHQNQINLGSRILSSDLNQSMPSPAAEYSQENVHIGNCDSNGYYYAPRSALRNDRMCLPSSFIADFARSLATDSMQETLQQNNGFHEELQRTLPASYNGINKNMAKALEYGNLRPLQGTGKCCAALTGNGAVQPQVLHKAMHDTQNFSIECMNCMSGSAAVSQKIHNSLSSGTPFRADSSKNCFNGTRESLLGAELASGFRNYGTVGYPVDQRVVHVLGNPVFKLMGQNVIVTSNSIKALGSCERNGVQHFSPSSSIKHLGLLPEPHNHYAHNLNPEVFSCTHFEAWHGDQITNYPLRANSTEISAHAAQNLSTTKSFHVKMPAHQDPSFLKPQMPICIFDEELHSFKPIRESVTKKLAFANPGSKMVCEGLIENLPGASSSFPTGLSRCGVIAPQQSRKQFPSRNYTLAKNEQQCCGFPQSRPVTFLENKLNVSSCYRSGTLADIVQSSERSNS